MRIGKRDFLKALFTLEVSGRPADAGACRCRNAIVDPRDVIGGLLFLRRRLHRYASPSGNIGQPIGSRRNRYRAGVGEFAVYRLDGDDCRPLCQRRDKAGLIDRSDQRLVGRPSQSLIGCALRCNRRIQLAGSTARNQLHRLWSQRDPRHRYDRSIQATDLQLRQLDKPICGWGEVHPNVLRLHIVKPHDKGHTRLLIRLDTALDQSRLTPAIPVSRGTDRNRCRKTAVIGPTGIEFERIEFSALAQVEGCPHWISALRAVAGPAHTGAVGRTAGIVDRPSGAVDQMQITPLVRMGAGNRQFRADRHVFPTVEQLDFTDLQISFF